MPRMATLVSWVSKEMEGSVHVVPVTSAPETTWAGIAAAREAERAARTRVEMYMLIDFFRFEKGIGYVEMEMENVDMVWKI
jgi:hypothetical protein